MPLPAPSRLCAAILAGGQSRRLGTDKRVLQLPNGTSLAGRVLREWLAFPHPWAWVGPLPSPLPQDWPSAVEHEPERFIRLTDHPLAAEAQAGPLAGVAAALDWARQNGADACLVLAVDMPLLRRVHLEQIAQAWVSQPESVTAASGPHGIEPLCAIYPSSLLAELEVALQGDIRSAKRFLADSGRQVQSISLENRAFGAQVMGCVTDAQPRFDTIHPCFNLNRPEDQELFFGWLEQGVVQ